MISECWYYVAHSDAQESGLILKPVKPAPQEFVLWSPQIESRATPARMC